MRKPDPIPTGSRYEPRVYGVHSWDDVVEFFAGFAAINPQCAPIHEFASRVASAYGKVLFPVTSMHTLIISPSSRHEWGHDVLHVDFDCSKQKFFFKYLEQGALQGDDKRRGWSRACGASGGFGAFERFLALKRWIVEVPPQSGTDAQ